MFRTTSIRRAASATGKVSVLAVLAYLLWEQLRGLDGDAVLRLFDELGVAAILILLPYAFVLLLDTRGWRHTFPVPRSVPLAQLGLIRVATDSVMNTFPAGVAFAEALRPMLLRTRIGLAWTDAISVTIVSKINIAVTQMLFILTGLGLAALSYSDRLRDTVLFSSPAGVALSAAIVSALGAVLWLPYSGGRLTALARLLRRTPFAALRQRLLGLERSLEDIDSYLARYRRERRSRLLHSLGYFLLSWFVMAGETWLILSLLGADVTVVQAVIIESLASVIKVVFFFIPSALGVMEIGFITLIGGLGISDALPLAAAFILLRRGKELVWALVGFAGFWRLGINPFTPAYLAK
jgi:uncharacterized membrane protein YbhN (UPF0104 family)